MSLNRSCTRLWKQRFRTGPKLLAASVLLGGAVCAQGQAGALPPTAQTGLSGAGSGVSPSQMPSANPAARAGTTEVGATESGAKESGATGSSITWNGRLLQVNASNIGLNGLLQEIAAKTGMRVTGTAPEERIYGTYGPGTLDAVLSKLLDGVPVNVLLVDRSGKDRKELALTARTGGPTPPSPATQVSAPPPDASAQRQGGFFGGRRDGVREGPPPDSQVSPPSQNLGQDPGAATADGNGVQPTSPNGVKSPQEIFEQLQRLRTQQSQSQTTQ